MSPFSFGAGPMAVDFTSSITRSIGHLPCVPIHKGCQNGRSQGAFFMAAAGLRLGACATAAVAEVFDSKGLDKTLWCSVPCAPTSLTRGQKLLVISVELTSHNAPWQWISHDVFTAFFHQAGQRWCRIGGII